LDDRKLSIRIGSIEFRLPWARYADTYSKIRKSVGEDIAQEIELEMEAMLPPVDEEEFAIYRTAEHCAKIARGIK
jgi:hypothetical protein